MIIFTAGLSVNHLGNVSANAGVEPACQTFQELDPELPELEEFVPQDISATRMAAGFAAASPNNQQEVASEVTEQLRTYATKTGIKIPF